MKRFLIFIILMPLVYWLIGVSFVSFVENENYFVVSIMDWDRAVRGLYAAFVTLTIVTVAVTFSDI